jgi:hypothetical protein
VNGGGHFEHRTQVPVHSLEASPFRECTVEQPLDLEHVQADELRVRTQGGVIWMAMALMVSTRLWLGGTVGYPRGEAAQLRADCAPGAADQALYTACYVAAEQGCSRELSHGIPEYVQHTTTQRMVPTKVVGYELQ